MKYAVIYWSEQTERWCFWRHTKSLADAKHFYEACCQVHSHVNLIAVQILEDQEPAEWSNSNGCNPPPRTKPKV